MDFLEWSRPQQSLRTNRNDISSGVGVYIECTHTNTETSSLYIYKCTYIPYAMTYPNNKSKHGDNYKHPNGQ